MVDLISMLGRRSNDPVLIEFMAQTVAKKCPPTRLGIAFLHSAPASHFAFDPSWVATFGDPGGNRVRLDEPT